MSQGLPTILIAVIAGVVIANAVFVALFYGLVFIQAFRGEKTILSGSPHYGNDTVRIVPSFGTRLNSLTNTRYAITIGSAFAVIAAAHLLADPDDKNISGLTWFVLTMISLAAISSTTENLQLKLARRPDVGLLTASVALWTRALFSRETRTAANAFFTSYAPQGLPAIPSIRTFRFLVLHSQTRRWTEADCAKLLEAATGRDDRELFVLELVLSEELLEQGALSTSTLDAWSQRAVALAPDIPTVLGTRGAVLCLLGQADEARELLTPLIDAGSSVDRAYSLFYLARAEALAGNKGRAEKLVTRFRAEFETDPSVRRIVTMLSPRIETEILPPAETAG